MLCTTWTSHEKENRKFNIPVTIKHMSATTIRTDLPKFRRVLWKYLPLKCSLPAKSFFKLAYCITVYTSGLLMSIQIYMWHRNRKNLIYLWRRPDHGAVWWERSQLSCNDGQNRARRLRCKYKEQNWCSVQWNQLWTEPLLLCCGRPLSWSSAWCRAACMHAVIVCHFALKLSFHGRFRFMTFTENCGFLIMRPLSLCPSVKLSTGWPLLRRPLSRTPRDLFLLTRTNVIIRPRISKYKYFPFLFSTGTRW